MSGPTPNPGVVVGIGNDFRQDDRVGLAVLRAVTGRIGFGSISTSVEVVESDGEASRLIELWMNRPFAIVVDAARGDGPPGSFEVMAVGDGLQPEWRRGSGSHDSGLADAIALAAPLGRLPDRLIVVTVQGRAFGHGHELSPSVAAAVEPVASRVETLVRAMVRERVREPVRESVGEAGCDAQGELLDEELEVKPTETPEGTPEERLTEEQAHVHG